MMVVMVVAMSGCIVMVVMDDSCGSGIHSDGCDGSWLW